MAIKQCVVCGEDFDGPARYRTCSPEHSKIYSNGKSGRAYRLNPEKFRAKARSRRLRDPEKALAQDAARREKNREKFRKWGREHKRREREKNIEKFRLLDRNRDRVKRRASTNARNRKISNLLAVLHAEMPELLKEFGL